VIALSLSSARSDFSAVMTDDFSGVPLPPEIDGLIGLPQTYAGNRRLYLDLVARTAERAGLPPDLVDAVVHVESGD
jgi:soluble lytic murein transglycosylase-like protein